MRFRVVLDVGTLPRIQVAAGTLFDGHVVLRHYYRTGLPATPRARVVRLITRYECSCGVEWYGSKPSTAEVLAHKEAATV